MPNELNGDFFKKKTEEAIENPVVEEVDELPENIVKITAKNVTIEIVIQALTALVYRAGRYKDAIHDMAMQGFEITQPQLKNWRDGEYAEDYKRIRENFSKKAEEEMVGDFRDIIRLASQAERKYIERTLEQGDKPISPKDAALAAFNLSRVKENNVDKLNSLLGRPTTIIEDRSPETALRRLMALKIIRPSQEDD